MQQKNSNSLQELFLSKLRRSGMSATIFLMNGFQFRGVVIAFDPFTVVVHTEGKQQIIYKHAISTIVPERPIDLREYIDPEQAGQ
ncbi:MAG: RNA chaperone Hfq [Clostridiales bacterium]|nr:RNA chaperone Hfq [Clostridiales bacterium]